MPSTAEFNLNLNAHLRFLLVLRTSDYSGDCEQFTDELFDYGADDVVRLKDPPYFAERVPVVKVSSTRFNPVYFQSPMIVKNQDGSTMWLDEENEIPVIVEVGGWVKPKDTTDFVKWKGFGYDHHIAEEDWHPNGVGHPDAKPADYPKSIKAQKKDKIQAYVMYVRDLAHLVNYIEEDTIMFGDDYFETQQSYYNPLRTSFIHYEWEDGTRCQVAYIVRT